MTEDGSTKVPIDDLPFYGEAVKTEYTARPVEESILEDGFKVVREGVNEGVNAYRGACESVNHVIETGSAHSSVAYYQLREEENLPARLALISTAGLLGLMVGSLRGRIFKKVLYSGLGAGAGASFCYPDEAKEAGDMVYQEGRRTALVAYNFITGGKLIFLYFLCSFFCTLWFCSF